MTQWGIDTLFNPGKRHMDEEKRRLQSTREEVGDSSGGRRIDLESGSVRLARKPGTAPSEEDAAEDVTDGDSGSSEDAGELATAELATAEVATDEPDEDTPAARARRRRRANG